MALSPDIMWVYRYFWFERKGLEPPAGPITRFHKQLQWSEKPWGIAVEWPFLAVLAYAIWNMVG